MGGAPFSPPVARYILGHFREPEGKGGLTETQRRVLRLLGQGLLTKEIAGLLGVSESAVNKLAARVKRKLGAATRAAAARHPG